MLKTKTYRMRLTSYKRIRSSFPAERGESVVAYFDRLSKELGKNNEKA